MLPECERSLDLPIDESIGRDLVLSDPSFLERAHSNLDHGARPVGEFTWRFDHLCLFPGWGEFLKRVGLEMPLSQRVHGRSDDAGSFKC